MSERVLLGARIPSELKKLVDADSRTNQDVVEAALWREFGGKRHGAIERRINELEKRRMQVQSEMASREEEVNEIDDEIESLRNEMETAEKGKRKRVRKAAETMDWLDPDKLTIAIIENWAEEAGIAESEFEEVYKEVWTDEKRD